MAKATRNSRLESRNARTKLSSNHEPYWVSVDRTLHLGYRKGQRGGAWIARIYRDGKYKKHKIGNADDYQDANNIDVFDYFQAQEKARQTANELIQKKVGHSGKPITVKDAIENYLKWYQIHRKSLDRARAYR